ncbi:MAG: iron donor protein CyaY [Burkholderiales bacterium]|nr:MAG: iron donor protein CyaY [Betaproteobacteria bacterium]TAG48787.1 MAG: iron donor protein CyaY [Betaproteobacteria bacterium]TAG66862.1 MAG: iron donor protein CyaY [Burkholderiales bacterium]TAG84313.1 MAG: iron donor protein CyaY [Betaproteobacteria bacterium]
MLDPTEFDALVDVVFDRIVDTLDASDADCDIELNQGVLEISCADRSKIIVNRHGPNQEIWVAAKSGGFHFKHQNNEWIDTRSGDTLPTTLNRVVNLQTGQSLKF